MYNSRNTRSQLQVQESEIKKCYQLGEINSRKINTSKPDSFGLYAFDDIHTR